MEDVAHNPEKGKKVLSRKVWLWIAGGSAALLLVLLLIGLSTEWFGLYGPLTKVAMGTKKLADAGNVTVGFSVTAPGDTRVEGTLECCWNLEMRDVSADLQLKLNGEDYRFGLVDGHVVWRNDRGKAKSADISEELNDLFDAMESESDLDESLAEFLKSVFKTAGIHKMVDVENAVACLKDGFFRWNRTGWLEENAGFTLEKEDDTACYSFEPKTGKLLLEMMRQFEPAFKDHSDYLDVISGLRELKPQLNEDYRIDAKLTLIDGVLSRIDADVDWKETQVSATVRFEEVGTTKVDTTFLRGIKNEADQ